MGTPADAGNKKGPLDVVVVYAFDCTTVTPNWDKVNQAYWLVQSKLAKFPGSCLSYLYPWFASNRYTTEKRTINGDGTTKNILPESTTGCAKNMASGLQEAHRLISLSSANPNGVILLFSDGSPNNKGDFFDKAENFVSTVPVHTFTLGSDAYNQGLRNIAANSPGGTFNSIPIPGKQPDPWSPISRLLDSILSDTVNDIPKNPTLYSGTGPLDVVVLYAFDCTTATPNWDRVNQAYYNVQSKLGKFPGSCLSYLYPVLASNRYTTEKRTVGGGIKSILPESATGCAKDMASGLQEAHRLISFSSTNPNGIILLFSDGSPNNKGDFFDKAEDFISTVPVHTFTLGSDAYNQGLCTIAANSPGGSFNSIPVPNNQDPSSPFSLLLDGILSGALNDDETTPALNTGRPKSVVTINQIKYFKDDAALVADTVTAEVELKGTSSTAFREGLDLVVVLDVSSRMATKIDSLKNAMKFVIMKLTPMDRLSMVIFSDGAARLNPLRSMTPEAQKDLIALVDGLKAHGGTNIKFGLGTGLAVVAGRVNTKGRTANVFLMTDGKQTVGDAKKVDVVQVPVYTFGFGNDLDHNLLNDVASRSHGGLFSAVPDGTNLTVPFSQLLGGLLTVVAQDLQLKLNPIKDAGDLDTIVVAPGTDYTQDVDTTTGNITITFGTIFAGESRKVILTMTLKDSTNPTEYDAELTYAQIFFTVQGKLRDPPRLKATILRVPKPTQAAGTSDKSRELQAELARRAEADAIRKARILADAGNLDEARYTLMDALNALEDVMLNDGQKLVNALRAELVQLIRLMDYKGIYESNGRAYALAAEASHGRQRYAARGGGGDDDVRLFSTPRMDSYLDQAKNFEKDPTAPVPSAAEDVKQEVAANPLAAISGDLAMYLRTAIEALQGMQKIIAAKA